MDAKVTVGLPCYNAEKTIELAVRSIIAQTYNAWRLIIVDDGSSDNTAVIAARISGQDSRIELIVNDHNRGLAACLNHITLLTQTDLLFRMDADDVMFPSRLALQTEYMQINTDCDLLGTAIVSIDLNENVRAVRRPPQNISGIAEVLRGEVLYHPTLCGRTQWFRQNAYNECFQVSEDFELLARTAGDVTIRNLRTALLFYREYGSFSYRKYLDQSKAARTVIARYGPPRVGLWKTILLQLQRRVKDFFYFVMSIFGLWEKSLNVHNQSLSEDRKNRYQRVLNQLKNKHIPAETKKTIIYE